MTLLPEEICKELEFKVEKSLKQRGFNLTYVSGNSVSYSIIKPPTPHFQKCTDYALLKLSKPAILQKIAFIHRNDEIVCNVKSFQLFAGMLENGCEILLEGNLHKEFEVEEFLLKNKIDGVLVPCLYIKIFPLEYWDSFAKFKVSSSIFLFGTQDDKLTEDGLASYRQHQNQVAAQLCLKFLRDAGHVEAFEVVSRSLGVTMEHPVVAELYCNLVKFGDYRKVEVLLRDAFCGGLCAEYLANLPCFARWQELLPETPEARWPPSRGGHQICMDPDNQILYLFGGWNGLHDLCDFWKFDVKTKQWTCISENTSKEGGPAPLSCHKMCIDAKKQKLYTFGKYLEHHKRVPENLKSDFYSYNIGTNEWTLLSEDTSADGGPPLVFDHQVAIDNDRGHIYVFGGNTLISSIASEERPSNQTTVSSLYSYNILTNSWRLLRRSDPVLSTRIGHSLLYHPGLKYLFIFAGQQNRQSINDLQVYDMTNLDDIKHLDYLSTKDFLPAPLVGFTHRSILDSKSNEIHILTGISKDLSLEKPRDVKRNTLWVYKIFRGTWQSIHNEDAAESHARSSATHPAPRFAHQFVYNPVTKVHYLFGGNPNHDCTSETRLNDLWTLELTQMDNTKLSDDVRYLVRKHCYREMTHLDATEALRYLQNDLYNSIDLSNHEQLAEFETLPSLLFKTYLLDDNKPGESVCSATSGSKKVACETRKIRLELFDLVSRYFPDDAKQPSIDLVDLIPRRPWDPLCAIGPTPAEK